LFAPAGHLKLLTTFEVSNYLPKLHPSSVPYSALGDLELQVEELMVLQPHERAEANDSLTTLEGVKGSPRLGIRLRGVPSIDPGLC